MLSRLLLFFILSLSGVLSANPTFKWELSIAAVFQNEARFLKEWIEFHRLVGVEHFWLYNNRSSDSFRQVLRPYLDLGVVELIEWPEEAQNLVHWNDIQCSAFRDATERAKGRSWWVAFIDTDEFLFAVNENSVAEFLKDYRNCAGVSVNWRGFGTSGVERIPKDALLIETLFHCNSSTDSWNLHTKAIVNPYFVQDCTNPHFFSFIRALPQMTTKKVPFTGPFSPSIDLSDLRLNHYWTRDEEFLFHDKIPRYLAWGSTSDKVLERANSFNLETDFEISRFIPELKKRLK